MKNSKKGKLTGFGDVFKFTYIQSMKSKATIITLAVFCVIALISFPVMSLFEDSGIIENSEISNIYILQDDAGIAEGLTKVISSEEAYKNVKISSVENESLEAAKEKYISDDKSKNVIIDIVLENNINNDNYGVNYSIYYNEDGGLEDSEGDSLATLIESSAYKILYMSVGIDDKDAEVLSQYISYNVYALDENGNVISDGISEAQYTINYFILMIILISISFAGSKVAEQIVTEKASKVVEYILTSVRPMAIITGKVMASLAVVFTILGCVLCSFVVSGFINGAMGMADGGGFVLPEIISDVFNADIMAGANIFTVIVSIMIFAEGFIFYGFLAGVSGAMVSKVEELAEGVKLFSFAMLIGAYLAMALLISSNMAGEGWGQLNNIVYFLPLSAPFIVPAYMLFDIIPLSTGLLIAGANIFFILILVWLVSGIYEQLIYHNGSPLKIKELLKLNKKGGSR